MHPHFAQKSSIHAFGSACNTQPLHAGLQACVEVFEPQENIKGPASCSPRNSEFRHVTEMWCFALQKQEIALEILNYRKNGEKFWNLLSLMPVKDACGNVVSFIGVQSDITELIRRKHAERELQQAKVGNPGPSIAAYAPAVVHAATGMCLRRLAVSKLWDSGLPLQRSIQTPKLRA